jgi:hypothetical protein
MPITMNIDQTSSQSLRSETFSTVDQTNLKISYSLEELLMQCNFDIPMSDEDIEWLNYRAQGRELI